VDLTEEELVLMEEAADLTEEEVDLTEEDLVLMEEEANLTEEELVHMEEEVDLTVEELVLTVNLHVMVPEEVDLTVEELVLTAKLHVMVPEAMGLGSCSTISNLKDTEVVTVNPLTVLVLTVLVLPVLVLTVLVHTVLVHTVLVHTDKPHLKDLTEDTSHQEVVTEVATGVVTELLSDCNSVPLSRLHLHHHLLLPRSHPSLLSPHHQNPPRNRQHPTIPQLILLLHTEEELTEAPRLTTKEVHTEE
jgi:hypothetical protein